MKKIDSADSSPLQFTQSDVAKSIKSFRAGTAPGPSGLRPEHIKTAVFAASNSRADKCLSTITKLVNILAGGQLPSSVAPYFCGGRLLAINKKCGGIQPITIGEVLRHLVAKSMVTATAKAASILAPLQLGVGVCGGCEAIIHSIKAALDSDIVDDNKWLLQVDLINAYNVCDRKRFGLISLN